MYPIFRTIGIVMVTIGGVRFVYEYIMDDKVDESERMPYFYPSKIATIPLVLGGLFALITVI